MSRYFRKFQNTASKVRQEPSADAAFRARLRECVVLSIYESHGVGLADTRVHDVRGPIGRALQSLLIEARP